MKVAIMQPYLFPYIGYFQLIKAVDTFVVYDDVNYITGGWINRNNLLISGKPYKFTIKLREASQNKLINQIEVGDDFKNFLKTVEVNYARAPFFNPTFELLKKICSNPEKNLAAFAAQSLRDIADYLNIQTTFLMSSQVDKDVDLRAKAKIVAICNKLTADAYVNLPGGRALYDQTSFKEAGLKLFFIEPGIKSYPQFNNQFVPSLSIIDVMMFNSPEQVQQMVAQFELVSS